MLVGYDEQTVSCHIACHEWECAFLLLRFSVQFSAKMFHYTEWTQSDFARSGNANIVVLLSTFR